MSDDVTAAITESISGLEGSDAATAESTPSAASASPVQGTAPPPSNQPTDPAPGTQPLAAPKMPTDAVVPKPARRGPIPYERHETVLAETRAGHEKAIGELKAQHEQALTVSRQQQQLLEIAEREPERFLDALINADPRYGALIASRHGGNGNGNGNGRAPETPRAASPAEMPGPDQPDGYSLSGLQKVLDWHANLIEQRLAKRYEPIEQEHRMQGQIREAVQRVQTQVQAAEAWPGFSEHKAEISAALKADRALNLEGAYRQVVLAKMKPPDENAMRQRLLAEINAKPKAASGTTPSGGAPPSAGDGSIEGVVRAAIANLPGR